MLFPVFGCTRIYYPCTTKNYRNHGKLSVGKKLKQKTDSFNGGIEWRSVHCALCNMSEAHREHAAALTVQIYADMLMILLLCKLVPIGFAL